MRPDALYFPVMRVKSIAAALLVCLFLAPVTARGQARTASPEEREFMRYFGLNIDMIDSSTVTLLKGGCRTNPYATLESKYKGSANAQISPRFVSAQPLKLKAGIDPALACRLVELFDAASARGCHPRISSAFRSAAQQESMCGAGRSGCAPAGKSCHQYGLAIDVSARCIPWLRQNAKNFGLTFPYYGNHIQCAEHRIASCSPQTPPCNGSVQINSDPTQIASLAPLGLGDIFRRMTQPQQQASPQQPLPQANQQALQSAFQPAGSVSSTATASNNAGVGTAASQSTSTIDLLSSIAYGTTSDSVAVPSATFVPVSIDTSDVQVLRPEEHPDSYTLLPGGAQTAPYGQADTFTSPDLNPEFYAPSQLYDTQRSTLDGIRARLLSLLGYLQPFGGRALPNNRDEGEHE